MRTLIRWYLVFVLCLASSVCAQEKKLDTLKPEATRKDDAKKDETKKEDAEKKDVENLLKPTNKVDSWRFEEADGGKGKVSVEEDWIAFKVAEITGTDWHVQAVQPGLDLKEGVEYKLTFEYKADTRRMAAVNAMIDEDDWHEIGLHEDLYANTTPQKYETVFRASGVNTKKKNRITFTLGTDRGTLYLKNVRLTEVKASTKP